MRASAGLDGSDALRRQGPDAHEILGVPFGVDIVGNRSDLVPPAQSFAQRVHERGFARSDRATDADAERTVRIGHDLNNRVYWACCACWAGSHRCTRDIVGFRPSLLLIDMVMVVAMFLFIGTRF